MGNSTEMVTITVPAEHADVFRANVFGTYETRVDSLEVDVGNHIFDRSRPANRPAATREDILADRDELRAVEAILDQMDWHRFHEGDEPLTITGPSRWVRLIVQGCLNDAGDQVHDVTERAPLDAAELARVVARVQWFAQELGEEPVAVLREAEAVA